VAGEVLDRLRSFQPRSVEIDGCLFREGLNAVNITGGVASNVIPDECVITVNFRFAPDRDPAGAVGLLEELFDGCELDVLDVAAGALPGLSAPAAAEFVAATGWGAVAKYG